MPHRIIMKDAVGIIEMRCGESSIVMNPNHIEFRVTDGTTTSLLTLTADRHRRPGGVNGDGDLDRR